MMMMIHLMHGPHEKDVQAKPSVQLFALLFYAKLRKISDTSKLIMIFKMPITCSLARNGNRTCRCHHDCKKETLSGIFKTINPTFFPSYLLFYLIVRMRVVDRQSHQPDGSMGIIHLTQQTFCQRQYLVFGL